MVFLRATGYHCSIYVLALGCTGITHRFLRCAMAWGLTWGCLSQLPRHIGRLHPGISPPSSSLPGRQRQCLALIREAFLYPLLSGLCLEVGRNWGHFSGTLQPPTPFYHFPLVAGFPLPVNFIRAFTYLMPILSNLQLMPGPTILK